MNEELPRIVIVDHYDSYTRNLLPLISSCFEPPPSAELLNNRVTVIRHTHEALEAEEFCANFLPHVDALILSPGPGSAESLSDFGTSMSLLQHPALHDFPILGVCLGHQGIAKAAGGTIDQLSEPFHGRKRALFMSETGRTDGLRSIMDGVEDGTETICYNSLIVNEDSLPEYISVTARSYLDGESKKTIVQAIEHNKQPHFGVQFHPESIESCAGNVVLRNFLHNVAKVWSKKEPSRVRAWADPATCLPAQIQSLGTFCVAQGNALPLHEKKWRLQQKSWPAAQSLREVLAVQAPALMKRLFRSDEVGSVWLDSASPFDPQSNVSVMSHSDFVLTYNMEGCLQLALGGNHSLQQVDMGSHEQFWDWLDEVQRTIQSQMKDLSPNRSTTFRTGFLGIWSYEMKDESLNLKKLSAENYEGCSNTLVDRMELPAAQWAFCSKVLCLDHTSMTWTAYALVKDEGYAVGTLVQLEQLGAQIGVQARDAEKWFCEVEVAVLETSNISKSLTQGLALSVDALDDGAVYMEKVEEARKLISMGESYEICLTTQFEGSVPGLDGYDDYFSMYCALRRKNPAPFGAYLELLPLYGKPQAILSTSPERFLTVAEDGHVEMRPIKGTKVRPGWGPGEEDWFSKAADPDMKTFMEQEDRRRKMQLHKDPKERAENLMIADLIRADLQSVCYPGSVTVPRLIALETYETVHQLVTSVVGTLRPGIGCVEATKRCFPPGSMTGAPKRRSVELIETLERPLHQPGMSSRRRAMYSGALGFIGVDGASNLSIVIRTVTVQANNVTVGAGGAITFLSSPEGEWDEVLTKLGSVAALAT